MKILDIARSQLGISESPPNSNRVKYSAWYGMVGPWCDMFISWLADQAGEVDAIGRFAYTPSHEAWFRSKGRQINPRDAREGDIVFFNFIGRTSHVGIIESRRGDGLITIEGNTNGGGSRDGGSVVRHFRSWNSGISSVQRPVYKNSGDDEMDDADWTKMDQRLKDRDEVNQIIVAKAEERIMLGVADLVGAIEDGKVNPARLGEYSRKYYLEVNPKPGT